MAVLTLASNRETSLDLKNRLEHGNAGPAAAIRQLGEAWEKENMIAGEMVYPGRP